jgi:hypothetical protein
MRGGIRYLPFVDRRARPPNRKAVMAAKKTKPAAAPKGGKGSKKTKPVKGY